MQETKKGLETGPTPEDAARSNAAIYAESRTWAAATRGRTLCYSAHMYHIGVNLWRRRSLLNPNASATLTREAMPAGPKAAGNR